MAVSLEQLDVIQSAELIGMHREQSRVYITSEWSTYRSIREPFDACYELPFVPHAGFVLASMLQIAEVPIRANKLDQHLVNIASLVKINRPDAQPSPLVVNGVLDKTRKATALRSLEFGTINPIKYHIFRLGFAPAKTALIMLCRDISQEANGIESIEKYHESLGSTDSRRAADIAIFRREFAKRKKLSTKL